MIEFTMFTILKVHTSGWGADMNTLRMMAAQVEKQDSRSLCKLEVEDLKLNSLLFFSEQRKSLLELIKASEEWNIDSVYVRRDVEMDDKGFSDLAKCSTRGHVATMVLFNNYGDKPLIKEDVKAIWEISEDIRVDGGRVGGKRNKDSNITWEEAYESLKMFC